MSASQVFMDQYHTIYGSLPFHLKLCKRRKRGREEWEEGFLLWTVNSSTTPSSPMRQTSTNTLQEGLVYGIYKYIY
jgi:hypothetical protein